MAVAASTLWLHANRLGGLSWGPRVRFDGLGSAGCFQGSSTGLLVCGPANSRRPEHLPALQASSRRHRVW